MKRSPDKQLQPDFDVYYLFTTLYLFFLPSVILILSIIYNVDCVLDLDIFVPVLPLLTASIKTRSIAFSITSEFARRPKAGYNFALICFRLNSLMFEISSK